MRGGWGDGRDGAGGMREGCGSGRRGEGGWRKAFMRGLCECGAVQRWRVMAASHRRRRQPRTRIIPTKRSVPPERSAVICRNGPRLPRHWLQCCVRRVPSC